MQVKNIGDCWNFWSLGKVIAIIFSIQQSIVFTVWRVTIYIEFSFKAFRNCFQMVPKLSVSGIPYFYDRIKCFGVSKKIVSKPPNLWCYQISYFPRVYNFISLISYKSAIDYDFVATSHGAVGISFYMWRGIRCGPIRLSVAHILTA